MTARNRFDPEKAIEVLLYIANRCPNIYWALKVLYFADKEHLSRYGRLICADRYVAMNLGPVPSGVYNLVKYVRGDEISFFNLPAERAFSVQGHLVKPLRDPNLDLLSESDIECLDNALTRIGKMTFDELKAISHREPAYQQADENGEISLEDLVRSLPNGQTVWDYLNDD